MKSVFAALALAAVALPSLAYAGQVIYDPSDFGGRFVAAPAATGSANAAAAAADVALYSKASAGSSGAVLGTHDATQAQAIKFYDPADFSGRFVSSVTVPNQANAAAAAADAAPYANVKPNMY